MTTYAEPVEAPRQARRAEDLPSYFAGPIACATSAAD